MKYNARPYSMNLSILLATSLALLLGLSIGTLPLMAKGGGGHGGGGSHGGGHSGGSHGGGSHGGGSHGGGSRTGGSHGTTSTGTTSHTTSTGNRTTHFSSGGHSFFGLRSNTAERAFQQSQPCPATGKTKGKCKGYVVGHVTPVACGGTNDVSNLQWQTAAEAKLQKKAGKSACP